MNRTMAALHRWLGLGAGALILVAAVTAIALNHQDLWKQFGTTGKAATSPYQKYVLSVGVDPAEPARVLVGTHDGLFRSVDGGKTWEEAILPVPAEGVSAIAFDTERPGVAYVAIRKAGVFRSEDHGDVWEEVPLPFYPPEGTEIAGLALGKAGSVTLATTDGLYAQAHPGGQWRHEAKEPGVARQQSNRLLQLVYDLHDGRFWGAYGVLITDVVAAAMIALVLTGYVMFFARAAARRRHAARRPIAILAGPAPSPVPAPVGAAARHAAETRSP